MRLVKDYGMTTLLVTGGIGSGKSLAAKYLAEMGVPVYDFDSRTKELYDSDSDLCLRVAEAVRPYSGEDVLTADGHIVRLALARAVFGNPPALAALEAVVHPAILDDFKAWRKAYAQKFAEDSSSDASKVVSGCLVSEKHGVRKLMLPMVAAESAIALSKPLFVDEFDKVILITAPEELRKSRVIDRDSLSDYEVTARMQAQSPHRPGSASAFASQKIDYIIENNGDRGELKEKLYGIIYKLTQK